MKRQTANRQCQPKQRLLIFIFVALVLAVFAACGRTPDNTVATNVGADEVLRGMSERLANARRLTFEVTSQNSSLVEGHSTPETVQIEIAVSRPNKVMAKLRSDDGVRRFYADGTNVTLLDEGRKLYATISLLGTIDETVARFDAKYEFIPPLAEFTLNDPYKKISQQIQSNTYVEREIVNRVECHHLKLVGKLADADLWITTKEQLPLRLITTYKEREGSPQLRADFSEWNLSATFDDQVFSFVPPKDAAKIEMIAIFLEKENELKAARKQRKQKWPTWELVGKKPNPGVSAQ